MIQVTERCKKYDEEVAKAISLIKYRKLILVFPIIILTIAILFLWVKVSVIFALFLIPVAVYGLIINPILSHSFKKHNENILSIFTAYYKPLATALPAKLIDDNKGFSNIVNRVQLTCWLENEQLHYITSELECLPNLILKQTSVATYQSIVRKDFGKLEVPLKDIDNYRDGVLSCKFGSSVCRLKFEGEKALDCFIPQKEFYFNAEKKNKLV